MIHWKDSSTWRFFKYSLVCFITIVVIFTTIYSIVTHHREHDYLEYSLRNIATTHVPNLIGSLWVTDYANVRRIINGIDRFRYIARVEVRDDTGRVFVSGTEARPFLEVVSRDLKYSYKDASIPIGSLSLFIDERQMHLDVLKSALYILALQLFLSVLLAGVIAGAFHMTFGRHLHRIAQFIKSDDPTQFDHPFALQRKVTPQDELQLLVDHFNNLRKRISGYVIKMEEANDELTAVNTQLLENECQLRESEEQYRILADNARDVIWIRGMDLKLKYISPSVEKVRGYTPDEAMNQTLDEALAPDSARRAVNMFSKLAQNRFGGEEKIEDHVIELEYRCRGGQTIWLECSVSLLKDKDARPSGILGVSRDITERRRIEAERIVLERRLHQVEKTESLSRMAGAVAHNFNNMLTVVMGNLELARMDLPEGGVIADRLAGAHHASRRAADMSRLMLTFLGQTPSRPTSLDLSKACLDRVAQLRGEISERAILETDLPGPGPVVKADPAMVGQVLTSLVTNAWEAMGDASGRIRVSVSTVKGRDIQEDHRFSADWQAATEEYACLTVADTGCGMEAQTVDRIFDPFYTDKFTGRGLGLAVALGIVKSFGGCITVESAPGRGSVFRVYIPLFSEATPQPASKKPPAGKEIDRGGVILLVEDQKMVRDAARVMLKRFGFDVLTAKDGIEAVHIFRGRQHDICLVLTDLSMPHMNGWETLTALRKIRPDIPVILASGYDEARAEAVDYPERPQVFLSKPYQMATLKAAVEEALGEN